MKKQIFNEENVSIEKKIEPKQEFDATKVSVEDETEQLTAELIIEKGFTPSRFWIRGLLAVLVLFGLAVIARSVQCLIDSVQAHQWIDLAFAIVFFMVSLAGIGAIIREWYWLVYLRKHQDTQHISKQLLMDELLVTSGQDNVVICHQILADLKSLPHIAVAKQRWQSQLNEAYNAKEVLYLFSENVLKPLDTQVKQIIAKSATENAIIVAVSPLVIVDMLMIAWRNIALVNKISRLYGMRLGYLSRLKLFKMVLTNMVFAGATEMATDVGMDFFSQNLTAKVSLRAAQGIGVGLLTARLGIKAMEFCRPIAFQKEERPKISEIRQQLLIAVKNRFFAKNEA
ncbi:membrane protein [[Haemophilus] ducreyi]|uniref:UPF0283 membrane protein HD_1769 n=1 Tax=Haemophilus ducreyi (strain 35000HP / ATCC 700724) TaxID=233412 RepID=Y1769_HAEDU|nr:TIGR01620 family protein [[Haemophilus] ducreyi]P59917.1 RecName: Full=UPF0283 membrane protein HD_1769 [[Haemophilus] ducreyi 35000HP]AAP96523.1 conserved hypothetical transmembrane protein [[Haemophilus] ducreyi 35000HP]AKO37184.1 membrane protein [[Haemophilus] ducreyi]AKO38642.1 membrane protein [[Haemophilus] ducreyi]AKO40182.1 membrane protein [[Haemophilus] ducreyi]AKO41667.1 membrane protein [[Haemophilus] ducreyi]